MYNCFFFLRCEHINDAYIHTFIHSFIHTYLYTYIHIHTYIHTYRYSVLFVESSYIRNTYIHTHTYLRTYKFYRSDPMHIHTGECIAAAYTALSVAAATKMLMFDDQQVSNRTIHTYIYTYTYANTYRLLISAFHLIFVGNIDFLGWAVSILDHF